LNPAHIIVRSLLIEEGVLYDDYCLTIASL